MSIEQVRITKVFKTDRPKGSQTPFKSKNGKPFWKVGILTDKFGDMWYSTLAFSQEDEVYKLEAGDEKTIKIWEENGFKNFKLPTKTDLLEIRVENIEKWIRDQVKKTDQTTSDGKPMPNFEKAKEYSTPPDEINAEDIPF